MIHPQSVVDPAADIDDSADIGAYSIIGPDVTIGGNTWVGPHVVINGPTTIGKNNKIYQFASIGDAPQHVDYKNEPTRLIVGDRNTIREYVTINRGTVAGGGITRIGNDNLLMAYSHIAHDCNVMDHTIFANGASLAGHVDVGDYAIFGGFTLVHQFCNIGAHSITAINTVVFKDIPPFVVASGYGAEPHGINVTGLKRRGFSEDVIETLKNAYKIIFRSSLSTEEALAALAPLVDQHPEIATLRRFIVKSKRGIIRA